MYKDEKEIDTHCMYFFVNGLVKLKFSLKTT